MDQQQTWHCQTFINYSMRVGCKAESRWTPDDGWVVRVAFSGHDYIDLCSMDDVYIFIGGYGIVPSFTKVLLRTHG